MGLIVKVGSKKDLPPEPLNFPKCGNFFFQGDSPSPSDNNEQDSKLGNLLTNLKDLFRMLNEIFKI